MEGASLPSWLIIPMSYRIAIAAFVVGAGLSLPAYSQTATPAPATAPAQPEAKKPAAEAKPEAGNISTISFGDWNLRCRADASPRYCEISQTIEAQDKAGPIAKISVGRPSPGANLHAIIILPNNVSFPSSVFIRTDVNDKWGVELNWLRCIPGGCFADAELSDATLAHWHSLDTIGNIIFRDAAGDEISLPMTFHGFGQALDAFNKS